MKIIFTSEIKYPYCKFVKKKKHLELVVNVCDASFCPNKLSAPKNGNCYLNCNYGTVFSPYF